MIYFIAGASGSGKTAILPDLKNILGDNYNIYDFDDIGVPSNADKKWRQETTETWLQKLLQENKNCCLLGQIVLGEILACPSIKKLNNINFCLLDVSDVERIKRLKQRNTYGDQNMLNWASWLRIHHQDPQWTQHVLSDECWHGLDFSKWNKFDTWPDSINLKILDTTGLAIKEVAGNVSNWITNRSNIFIETPRLILRSPRLADAAPLNQAINNSLTELQRWQPWANDPSLGTTTKFIKDSLDEMGLVSQKNFPVIVIHKQDNTIIGASGYNEKSDTSVPYYEIGYWLETAYTGQGLATELTNALTRYAFLKLKAPRVQIRVQVENIRSMNVAKRCGYEHEATLKKVRLDNISKQLVDDYIFSKLGLDGLPYVEAKW